ncbi:MAG TPA: hypothetical protein VF912_12840 [Anaeromyxobacter sp.]
MLPVATLLVASQPAQASPLAYEGFSLPLAAPFHGGAGFSGPWNNDLAPTLQGYSWSDSTLRITGLQASGGSVSGDASDLTFSLASRNLSTFVATYPTVYVSFLVQPRGTLNEGAAGGFFGLFLRGSSGYLFIGKPGAGAVDQYVLETLGGAAQVASGVPVVLGRTVLLVMKAQFTPANDVFTLYVDPPVKGSEPASGAVKSDLDLGPLSALGIYSGGAFAIDEIRVGTTYADVVVPSK